MDLQEFKNKIDNRDLWGNNEKENWYLANKWCEERNDNLGEAVKWSFDCGFKLDFDGALLFASSRFYPPHKSHEDYGKWQGNITFILLGEKIHQKEVEANTLDEIANSTEKYVKDKIEELKPKIKELFN
jgi:hypothetical protein